MRHSPTLYAALWSLGLSCAALRVHADIAAHPDLPGRLVETRGEFTVEYSPGQEAWRDLAFARLEANRTVPSPAPTDDPANAPVRGTPADLRARRDVFLTAAAQQIGLDGPTELQTRAFETFLGHYELLGEAYRQVGTTFADSMRPVHLAIWQRDDLIARLRGGATIPGITYDSATDAGQVNLATKLPEQLPSARADAIDAAIRAQHLHHRFEFDKGHLNAGVTLGTDPSPTPDRSAEAAADVAPSPPPPHLIYPVIYRGDFGAAPDASAFGLVDGIWQQLAASIATQCANHRDPTVVAIILHETVETGLVDAIIRSPDRRCLCEGTANYAAWRVIRDLIDPPFADEAINLAADLRRYASLQPQIDLARWSAVDHLGDAAQDTDLNRAHYAFATRALSFIAARHGDDAVARLWRDVARNPLAKVTAKTFANAYRKRYHGSLSSLVAAAEQDPIPPAPPPPPVTDNPS